MKGSVESPSASPSEVEIVERLQAILGSDEFRPRASDELGLWLDGFIESLLAGPAFQGESARVLSLLVVLVVVYAIAWWVYELVLSRRLMLLPALGSAGSAQAALSPPALPLDRARALADAGFVRDAARSLQAAVLQAACMERQLAWRPELSDGEWLALLCPSPDVVALTRLTERLAFGPEPSRAAFDACERAARALLASGGDPTR